MYPLEDSLFMSLSLYHHGSKNVTLSYANSAFKYSHAHSISENQYLIHLATPQDETVTKSQNNSGDANRVTLTK